MIKLIDKLHFIKIKNVYSLKDNVKRMRRQVTDQEKIFAKGTSDKRVPQNIQKNLKTQ